MTLASTETDCADLFAGLDVWSPWSTHWEAMGINYHSQQIAWPTGS